MTTENTSFHGSCTCKTIYPTVMYTNYYVSTYDVFLNVGISLQSGWPPVCFYDVANGDEQSQHDGSFYNVAEAEFVARFIDVILNHDDILPADIGVITLYRAQVATIQQRLQVSRWAFVVF